MIHTSETPYTRNRYPPESVNGPVRPYNLYDLPADDPERIRIEVMMAGLKPIKKPIQEVHYDIAQQKKRRRKG